AAPSGRRWSSSRSSTPIMGSSGMEFLPAEGGTQLEHTVPDARLHGAERRVLALRDLAVREALEVGDLDGAPLLLGQLGERLAHAHGALAAHDRLVGSLGGRVVLTLRDAAHLGAIARAAGTKVVEH